MLVRLRQPTPVAADRRARDRGPVAGQGLRPGGRRRESCTPTTATAGTTRCRSSPGWLGLTGRTGSGTPYDVVDLGDDLVAAPVPDTSVLSGRLVSRTWVEAATRVVVGRAVTDLTDGYAACLATLLGAAPEVAGADPADVAADLLAHLPPGARGGRRARSERRPGWRSPPPAPRQPHPRRRDGPARRRQRHRRPAGPGPVGVAPGRTRPAHRRLPGGTHARAASSPLEGAHAAHPLARAAARSVAAEPRLARVLSAATGGPDEGAAGRRPGALDGAGRPDPPRRRRRRPGRPPSPDRRPRRPSAPRGRARSPGRPALDKATVDRREVPLGFDPAAYPVGDFDALPTFFAPFDALRGRAPRERRRDALAPGRRRDRLRGGAGGPRRLRRVGRPRRRGRRDQPDGGLPRRSSGRRSRSTSAGGTTPHPPGRAQPLPAPAQLPRRVGRRADRRLQDRAGRTQRRPPPAHLANCQQPQRFCGVRRRQPDLHPHAGRAPRWWCAADSSSPCPRPGRASTSPPSPSCATRCWKRPTAGSSRRRSTTSRPASRVASSGSGGHRWTPRSRCSPRRSTSCSAPSRDWLGDRPRRSRAATTRERGADDRVRRRRPGLPPRQGCAVKVAVTGATGMVGGQVVAAALAAGHEVARHHAARPRAPRHAACAVGRDTRPGRDRRAHRPGRPAPRRCDGCDARGPLRRRLRLRRRPGRRGRAGQHRRHPRRPRGGRRSRGVPRRRHHARRSPAARACSPGRAPSATTSAPSRRPPTTRARSPRRTSRWRPGSASASRWSWPCPPSSSAVRSRASPRATPSCCATCSTRPAAPSPAAATSSTPATSAPGTSRLLEHGVAGERYLLGGEDLSWRMLHTLVSDLAGLPGPFAELDAGQRLGRSPPPPSGGPSCATRLR